MRCLPVVLCALALAGCSSPAAHPQPAPVRARPAATSTSVGITTTTLAPHAQAIADIRLYVPALDRTPVRDIVGEDPVAFVEEFKANYGLGSWISKEQRRLIDAIAAAEAATGEGEPS